MKIPIDFFEAIKNIATSPYSFIAYVVLVVAWAIVYLKTNRLKTIAKALKSLPESERKSILEKDYGYSLKTGMSAEHFLKAQRQSYIFYAFIALLLMLTALIITAEIHASPHSKLESTIFKIDSSDLSTSFNKVLNTMKNDFKTIKGDLNEDDTDDTCLVYNSLISIPNTTFNEIECCKGNKATFKATLYHGQNKNMARSKFLEFNDALKNLSEGWKALEHLFEKSKNQEYIIWGCNDQRVIVLFESDEKTASFWVQFRLFSENPQTVSDKPLK